MPPQMRLKTIQLTVRILGQGAFARILEGKVEKMAVAVKILKEPTTANRHCLARESSLMYQCQHRGVARVIGAQVQATGPMVLIMEKYHSSLSAIRMALTPKGYTASLTDIAGALRHLSDLLISRGDIKASTFLVKRPWQTVLTDFECAKKLPCAEFRTEEVTGTPAFWSPEAWLAISAKGDHCKHAPLKTDAFAFGVVFSELASTSPKMRRHAAACALALEGLLCPEGSRSSVTAALQQLPQLR